MQLGRHLSSMRLPVVTILAVSACAAPERHWRGTSGHCVVLDAGCTDALIGDFSVDLDSFPAVDPAADAQRALEGAPWEEAPLGWVVLALHQLHHDASGGPGDLWGSPVMHPDLARDLRPYRDRENVQEVVYDFAVEAIRGIRLSTKRDDLLGHYRFDGLVSVFTTGGHDSPAELASTLVHEARHGTGPDHVDCEVGDGRCDTDLSGSFGFEVVYGLLRAEHSNRSEELAWDAYDAVLQPAF